MQPELVAIFLTIGSPFLIWVFVAVLNWRQRRREYRRITHGFTPQSCIPSCPRCHKNPVPVPTVLCDTCVKEQL